MPRLSAGLLAACIVAPALAADETRPGGPLAWATLAKRFEPLHPRPGRSATVGPDGVALHFDATAQGQLAGVRADVTLRGDFQVALRYELTTFPDAVATGYGAMVGVWVDAGPVVGPAGVNRGVHQYGYGHQARLTRGVPQPGGKTHYAIFGTPTTARHGRLALRRVGTEVVGLFAETPDGELVEFHRAPFTDGPVRTITLSGDTGGAAVPLAARLYDVEVVTGVDVPTGPGKSARSVVINPLPAVMPDPKYVSPTATAEATALADPTAPAAPMVRGGWWLPGVGTLAGFVLGVVVGRRWRTAPK